MSRYSSFVEDGKPSYEGDEPEFEDVLYGWAKAGSDRVALQTKAAAKYHLDPASAASLVALTIERGGNESKSTPELKSRYVELAKKFPHEDLVFEEAARAIDNGAFGNCEPDEYRPLLATRADSDRARLLVFDTVWCLALLTERTGQRPDDPAPYIDLAERSTELSDPLLKLAVLRTAVSMAETDATITASRRADLQQRRLRAELDGGHAEEVARLVGSPNDDPALLKALTRSDKTAVTASFLLAGNQQKARAWRAEIGSAAKAQAKESGYEQGMRNAEDWTVQLLDMALAAEPHDDFIFLAHWFEYQSSIRVNNALWQALLERVASAEAYPGLRSAQKAEWTSRWRKEALEACVGCAPGLLAMIEKVSEADSKPSDMHTGPALPANVLANVERVMALPRPAWQERTLPLAQRTQRKPAKAAAEIDLADLLSPAPERPAPKLAWVGRLPKGTLVRYESAGPRLVAITASQTLDPTGEVSAGGYWISVSQDGGEHFEPPLYTGLRMFEPYVVLPESKLPMLDGDSIRLEVAVRKLDDEHVTLPPVALGFLETRDDVFIEATFQELRRDSDHDGLSDLAEWGMLLAPDIADTDADGILDGVDPLPHIAGNTRIRGADAMAFVLNRLFGGSLGALVTTDATGVPGRTSVGGPDTDVYQADATRFMAAPPAYFAGLSLKSRLIVLDEGLLDRLSKARGLSFTMGINNFEVSHDGNSAVVSWSTGWAGGAILLRRKGDSWEAETLMDWIT